MDNLKNHSKKVNMEKNKIYQIIAILISLSGVGVMGYSAGKGIENNYGYIMIVFGIALSLFVLLFGKKDNESIS